MKQDTATLRLERPGFVTEHPTKRSAARRKFVIERSRRLRRLDPRELWEYRSLFVVLTARNIQVRYTQTVLGVAWALLQPLIMMVVFTIIFDRFAGMASDGQPYQVFSLAAVVPWTYFASALSSASGSLGVNSSMITKVYFPRLVLPLSHITATLLDFSIGMVLLLVMLGWYGITPLASSIVVIPLLVLVIMLTATGIGCGLAALNVQYRDIRHIVPFMLQVWMYGSPIVYSVSIVPDRYLHLYSLNPMVGVVSGFRAVLLGSGPIDWSAIGVSLAVSGVLCAAGVLYFQYRERVFADVV